MQRVGAQLNFFVPGDCQVGSYVDLFDAARFLPNRENAGARHV